MDQVKLTRAALWTGAALALCYSVFALSDWFGQWASDERLGVLLALSIDAGIIAAMRASHMFPESHAGRMVTPMRVVTILAALSWLGNAQHALQMRLGRVPSLADWAAQDLVTWTNSLIVAGIAPLIALMLAHLYDGVSAHAAMPAAEAPAAGPVTVEDIRAFALAHPELDTQRAIAAELDVDPSRVSRAGVRRNGAGWYVEAGD